MNTVQRVVRRNGLLSRFLTGLVALAGALLGYAVVHANLSQAAQQRWPDLLDVQSATGAVLATSGAALARAQYARAVRPALGHTAHVAAGLAPADRLVWVCRLTNAAQDVAVVTDAAYLVRLAAPDAPPPVWGSALQARSAIDTAGLVHTEDYRVNMLDAGWPLGAQSSLVLGWFTAEAMAVVDEVYIRVRVTDRVGDTHERIMPVLKGADRHPRHAGTDPL